MLKQFSTTVAHIYPLYIDELSKRFDFSNAESKLSFKQFCEKRNLRWEPIIHTDPKRPSAYHKFDLEITENNHVKVDKKTPFRLEETMENLRQCSISNGPNQQYFRMTLEYFDENDNLLDAKELRWTKTDKRLIRESELFLLPDNLNMPIKEYLIINGFFDHPDKENFERMDIIPIAEGFYRPTDSIQQSKLNGKGRLIDPILDTISALIGKTVMIGRKYPAFGSFRCDNPECGLNCPRGIKRWPSAKSHKG